jgi:nitrate reductase NapE component
MEVRGPESSINPGPIVLKPPTALKGVSVMSSVAANSVERNDTVEDAEARQAARDAIMKIPLFPDLTVALRGALGYGPHVDMLQHLCYWMHPRHPKMQDRWTMYKTYKEWRDECSLSDRQVRKGRKVLRELGLVTEKKSNYGRIDYRVDWVALAKVLSLDTNTVQTDEDWDDFDLFGDDDSLDANTLRGQSGRYSDESSLDAISVQANAGEYAEDYLTGNSTLQVATKINKNGKTNEFSSPPVEDKRHSEDSDTASADIAVREVVEEVQAPPKPNDDALLNEVTDILNPDSGRWFLAAHVSAKHTAKTVADCILSEDGMSDVAHSVPYEDLLAAIEYVRWEEEEEVG